MAYQDDLPAHVRHNTMTVVCARTGCPATAQAPHKDGGMYPDLDAIGWSIADGMYHVCPQHTDTGEEEHPA